MKGPNRGFLKQAFGTVIALLSLGFLGYRIHGFGVSHVFDPSLFFKAGFEITFTAAFAFQTVIVGMLVLPWWSLLQDLARVRIPLGKAASVFWRANLAKYIPGSVFEMVTRQVLGSQWGISQRTLFISSLTELSFSFAVFGAFLCVEVSRPGSMVLSLSQGTIPWTVELLYGLEGLWLSLVIFAARRLGVQWRTAVLTLLIDTATFCLGACCFLLCLHFLGSEQTQETLVAKPLSAVVLFFSAYFAALFFPGSPGGLGVREASYVLVLGFLFAQDDILRAALGYRVVCILCDAFWGIFGILESGRNHKTETRSA